MQSVSEKYVEAMNSPFRGNRAYITGTIGIINSEAQENAGVDKEESEQMYYSNTKNIFNNLPVTKIYATFEQNFSKVDGSMYFAPKEHKETNYYNNGFVSMHLKGKIKITFKGHTGLEIKGLTINFGECYPTYFTIETELGTKTYKNDKEIFVMDENFDGISYFIITALEMVNGNGRLRVHNINFGLVDTISNKDVISFSLNEFVSPTSETLPSKDLEIIIDNQDSYYNPDNLKSSLSYLEQGQEIRTKLGYDVTGNGDIEWLPENLSYLSSWSANETQAQFICTDLFDSMTDIYYKGQYRERGISLYDEALNILTDAGIKEDKYYLDSYLKSVFIQNPVPPIKHSEALQLIANAGRCILYEDRNGKIHIRATFTPELYISSNGHTDYGKIENVLIDGEKVGYASWSKDFTGVGGGYFFLPKNGEYLKTGYASIQMSDENGYFEENPKIIITSKAGIVFYGLMIFFHSTYPSNFNIKTFYDNALIESINVIQENLVYDTKRRFEMCNKIQIEFTKGYPNSRVFIDGIKIGDGTDYKIKRDYLLGSPVVTQQDKVKKINIIRTVFTKGKEEKDLVSEEISISPSENKHTVYFKEPVFEIYAYIENNDYVKVEIEKRSSYFAEIKFSGITSIIKGKLIVKGKELKKEEFLYSKLHNQRGVDIECINPLISFNEHAKELQDWISNYYNGEFGYDFEWRGDPRVDANDLFYFEKKDNSEVKIRSYENSITFKGAFKGKIKARVVK